MASKPNTPQGTRDFSPIEVDRREFIVDSIKSSFRTFGFRPIETPSFENSETLFGKYGEEGDKLIYRILDSGEFRKGLELKILKDRNRAVHGGVGYIGNVDFSFIVLGLVNYLRMLSRDYIEERRQFLKEKRLIVQVVSEVIRDATRIKGHFESKIAEFLYIEDPKVYEIATTIVPEVVHKWFEVFRIEDFATTLLNIDEAEWMVDFEWRFEQQVRANFHIFLNAIDDAFGEIDFLKADINEVTPLISGRALRYDLTVPFARYVVQHRNEINLPFKRYQIQPVWRADRPQKGRYREFWQCDADVVGSNSLLQEVELVQLYDEVFHRLNLGVQIRLNHRKILSGLAECMGAEDKLIDFTVALDKLDKIGTEGVKKEMLEKGISPLAIERLRPVLELRGSFGDKMKVLREMLAGTKEGMQGVEDLTFIFEQVSALGLQGAELELDLTLARGLNYYTGTIFEVTSTEVQLGSIGGGGRYDNLTGIFGWEGLSGVGISFGLDRIYLVMEELNRFLEGSSQGVKALFLNMGEKESAYALQWVTRLRRAGISCDLYPDSAKFKKQFDFAGKLNIPYVVLAGENEMAENLVSVKDQLSGEQKSLNFDSLLALLTT